MLFLFEVFALKQGTRDKDKKGTYVHLPRLRVHRAQWLAKYVYCIYKRSSPLIGR